MSFTDWFSEVSSPNGLIYSLDERKEKSCCQLYAWYLLFDLKRLPLRLRFINDQIVEGKFLVLLVIDVIKPPGTYFNNWSQLSCRSSKFSSSFPATSVLLYAPQDPIREAGKCFLKIFLRQTLHASCDVQHVSFSKRLNKFMLDFR